MVTPRYARNPDFVHRRVGDGEVLVPRRIANDAAPIYVLNASGALIWDLLDRPRTALQLADAMVDAFEIERDAAATHVNALLDELRSLRAITEEVPG